MKYILETNNLTKNYHNFAALDNLNIHVEDKAIYGLIGRNGAGKTTLIRVICGLQKPTKGSYTLFNVNNKDAILPKVQKRINAIIEYPSVYMNLTAYENLVEQYKLMGYTSYDNINDLLKLVGLEEAGSKTVRNFSLGMRQRLGIALALATNPDFLILDEPTNGLDPEGIIDIRELILKLNKEKGITFLISSHYLDELSKIATCYGFMEKGSIIKEISAADLEKNKHKKFQLKVNDTSILVQYLEQNNMAYEVIDKENIIIYEEINLSKLILKLKNKDLIIREMKEIEESLESFYLNLVGGRNHD